MGDAPELAFTRSQWGALHFRSHVVGSDGLYFRVSSERQTTENQFEDLLQVAEKGSSGRDWQQIRQLLSRSVFTDQVPCQRGGHRTVHRIRPEIAAELASQCVYVEQGKSSRAGACRRPMFERLKRDAALNKFDRLLVWKVSRLGRDMREVISTVYELADLGVSVVPVRSQTGPINSTMGKLLWAIQAWYAEMENDERSDAIKAGHMRARANGKQIGRPRAVFRRDEVPILRKQSLSWRQIASRLGVSIGSVRRAFIELSNAAESSRSGVGDGS
jgi:putative DNA-invertase from lambdoid prophage Rac